MGTGSKSNKIRKAWPLEGRGVRMEEGRGEGGRRREKRIERNMRGETFYGNGS